MNRVFLVGSIAVAASLVALAVAQAGCGAGDVSPPPPLHGFADGGGDGPATTDAPNADAPAGTVPQTGKIVALQLNNAVAGATVTGNTGSATTDAKGAYTLAIDPTKSFHLQVAAPGYYSLFEQETLVTSTLDLGKTSLLSESTASVLLITLTGYDASLGVLSVAIEKKPTCPDEGGATFDYTVDGQPPTTSKMLYFKGNIPSPDQTSAESGDFPHAVIYNLPPGKPVNVTVKHPTCTPVPFPVQKDLSVDSSPPFGQQGSGKITYANATITTSAGKNTSFLRVFLK